MKLTVLALVASSIASSILFSRSAAPASPVDEVRIEKARHTLTLLSDGRALKTYRVAIGAGGAGPKRMEGDRVTPVGTYRVSGRLDLYHRFLNVSYPNEDDRARFRALKAKGQVPAGRGVGFGIGIHGTGHADWNGSHKETDWTNGCIALDDDEIDEVARLVRNGTRIVITD